MTTGGRPRLGARPAMPYAAAAGAVLGSWLLIGVPLALAVALAAVCAWRPSPLLVFAVFAALAGFFGSRALDGLADPPQGRVEGWVSLLDDPRPLGTNGIRVTVRHGGARLEARAYGAMAGRLDDALAGERVHVSGTARPATSDWHRWRHVAATLTVDAVGSRAEAAPVAAFANRVRRLLESGARSLPDDSRAMFGGMVYGDDRSQSPRLSDDFRAAGLGHLLVVSGQNVAFVLALASPLMVRARPGVRLVVLLALLGVFALLTRFEPSVLRAAAMAGGGRDKRGPRAARVWAPDPGLGGCRGAGGRPVPGAGARLPSCRCAPPAGCCGSPPRWPRRCPARARCGWRSPPPQAPSWR